MVLEDPSPFSRTKGKGKWRGKAVSVDTKTVTSPLKGDADFQIKFKRFGTQCVSGIPRRAIHFKSVICRL